jgi:hypothetical protein
MIDPELPICTTAERKGGEICVTTTCVDASCGLCVLWTAKTTAKTVRIRDESLEKRPEVFHFTSIRTTTEYRTDDGDGSQAPPY